MILATSGSGGPVSLFEWVLLASELLVTALGVTISYIAYRGYRRNDSRAMLLFCVGFALAVGLPAVAGALVAFGDVASPELGAGTSQLSRLLGMALILVALRSSA